MSYDFLESPTQAGDLGVLGHYRIISELGRGGMGFVFRAEDIKLKRSVALKVMNQKIAAVPNSRKRFLTEARSMAAIHHDNVVTIFEVGESKGTPFMAMEMLAGQTLESYNKSNPNLSFETIIEFASQIARGLAAAHAKGIVHRDIKPANIWIQEGVGRVKILDFGLALASTPVDQLAGRGAVIGTPGYLAPEQARSDPMDDRSDLYSLGVVLYEMCTGKLPIQAKSVPGQLVSILAHRPQPIQEINPAIPQPLCDLVHKLLRKEPRARVSSALRLQDELERVGEECQKTTETAQAINRLKEGLSEVVTKKSAVSTFDLIDEPEEIHDPLANLPQTPIAMVPPAAISGAMSTARPVNPKSIKQSASDAAPSWQVYLPIIAIVAVLLIALPVLTYFFTTFGRSTEAYVVDQASGPFPTQNLNTAPEPEVSPKTNQPPSPNQQNPNGGKWKRNNGNANGGNGNSNGNGDKNSNNRNGNSQNGNGGGSNKGTEKGNGADKPKGNPESSPSNPQSSPMIPTAESVTVSKMPAPEAVRNRPDPEPESMPAEEPAVESHWEVISTIDGRGADAMVQNGGVSEKLGKRPSFGVRTRNGIPINHSYLRFDLEKVKHLRKHVIKSGLILTVVGSKHPAGAALQVYGISDVGIWNEAKLEWDQTPSSDAAPKTLSQFPLLAEISVPEEPNPEDAGTNQVKISDQRITDFIAESDGLVTFAITGEWGQAQLRFVSREKSSDEAPQLLLDVPNNVPNRNNNN
ncbi:serine/threonine-protein kinase [Rubripirellula reticaptiva]|uniref:serine/threonine-protein kinase n=1 Tax=Rubripirellula reticaptiva TaxID=2528013 RepID=UPI001C969219|nr:serine/threonine-protein kinase [Rubripirellula reticaptiva]